MNGILWPLRPATRAKHRLYQRYLDGWWPVMLQPTHAGFLRPRITYVEGFAGPGGHAGAEPGAALLALRRVLDCERLGISATRFYQALNALISTERAPAYAPVTVHRLLSDRYRPRPPRSPRQLRAV